MLDIKNISLKHTGLFSPDFPCKNRVDSALGKKAPSRLSCRPFLRLRRWSQLCEGGRCGLAKHLPLSPMLGFIPQPSLTLLPAVGKVFQVHERG